MKNVLQQTLTTLALIVAMMTAAATVQAQNTEGPPSIVLDVLLGQKIYLKFKAAQEGTLIRVVNGIETDVFTADTSWTSRSYTTRKTAVFVYGDVIGFNCKENYGKITSVHTKKSLEELICSQNSFTNLDLSNNTALTYLNCNENNLINLDLSNNTALTYLSCAGNKLTNLDLSNNTALTYLGCSGNKLTAINISNNEALKDLSLGGNKLTNLDVSHIPDLKVLDCNNNQLATLNLSNNRALTQLYCDYNKLTSLDVSRNTTLTYLGCSGNKLTTLNVSNNTALKELVCSNNEFTTAVIDDIYCSLPDRSGIEAGTIQPVSDMYSPKLAIVRATTKGNATAKNWEVQYSGDQTDIPATTGNYDCSATSGIDNPLAAALTLYPNPVESILHIEAEGEVRSIRIYNIYGTEVATAAGTKQIDLSHLPAGVYALRVETEQGVATQRVVKK